MEINQFLYKLGFLSNDDRELLGITSNSKKVQENYCFIAYKGSSHDGNDYIEEAIRNGAILIISDDVDSRYYISNLKQKLLKVLMIFYNYNQKVKIIGITGTNGKSSTAKYCCDSLKQLNFKVKRVSTVLDNEEIHSDLTTPYQEEMIDILLNNNDLDYLILECSSIGIAEGRLYGINFDLIILTNIKEDHLDYHKTLEKYIFEKVNFINCNNTKTIMFKNEYDIHDFKIKKIFEISKLDIKIINCSIYHTIFQYQKEKYSIHLNGIINVENICLVIKMLQIFGTDNKKIKSIIVNLKPENGRIELISRKPLIFIDYAHTSSAMEKVLIDIKNITKKKIIVVFGAGGNREVQKRRRYGEIADKYCDKIIVTNDNPRYEQPEEIIDDICISINNPIRILSREKAIIKGIELATENHCLVILGKGHENYIEINGEKITFSDRNIVLNYLQNHIF